MLIGLILGALVWAALLFYGDAAATLAAMRSLNPGVLLASLVLSTLNFGIRAVRWQWLLIRVGVRIPHFESGIVFLAGLSMTLTPMKVGELLKAVLLKQSRDVSPTITAPIVMAERITDLVALVLLASLGSLALDRGFAVIIGGSLFVAAVMVVCTVRPVGNAVLWLCERLPVLGKRIDRLRVAYDHLGQLLRPLPFLLASGLGILAWGAQCIALMLLVDGFADASLSFEASLFAYSMPLLAGILSMLPGGLGLTEATMAGLVQELGGAGTSAAVAASATILCRLVTFWWAIALGLATLAYWRRHFTTTDVDPRLADVASLESEADKASHASG
jgi:uncharacterized membrane protein YbhN (UPF0104 family)